MHDQLSLVPLSRLRSRALDGAFSPVEIPSLLLRISLTARTGYLRIFGGTIFQLTFDAGRLIDLLSAAEDDALERNLLTGRYISAEQLAGALHDLPETTPTGRALVERGLLAVDVVTSVQRARARRMLEALLHGGGVTAWFEPASSDGGSDPDLDLFGAVWEAIWHTWPEDGLADLGRRLLEQEAEPVDGAQTYLHHVGAAQPILTCLSAARPVQREDAASFGALGLCGLVAPQRRGYVAATASAPSPAPPRAEQAAESASLLPLPLPPRVEQAAEAASLPPRAEQAAESASLPPYTGDAAEAVSLPPYTGDAAEAASLPPLSGDAAESASLPPDAEQPGEAAVLAQAASAPEGVSWHGEAAAEGELAADTAAASLPEPSCVASPSEQSGVEVQAVARPQATRRWALLGGIGAAAMVLLGAGTFILLSRGPAGEPGGPPSRPLPGLAPAAPAVAGGGSSVGAAQLSPTGDEQTPRLGPDEPAPSPGAGTSASAEESTPDSQGAADSVTGDDRRGARKRRNGSRPGRADTVEDDTTPEGQVGASASDAGEAPAAGAVAASPHATPSSPPKADGRGGSERSARTASENSKPPRAAAGGGSGSASSSPAAAEAGGAQPGVTAEALFRRGVELLEDKKPAKAAAELERCIAEHRDARCYYRLAQAYALLGREAATMEALRRFLEVAPNDPHAPRVRKILDAYEER